MIRKLIKKISPLFNNKSGKLNGSLNVTNGDFIFDSGHSLKIGKGYISGKVMAIN